MGLVADRSGRLVWAQPRVGHDPIHDPTDEESQ